MDPQNNIAGNRSFDKIFLNSFKISKGGGCCLGGAFTANWQNFPPVSSFPSVIFLFQNAFKLVKMSLLPTFPLCRIVSFTFAVNFKPEIDDFFSAESLEQEWPVFQLHVGKMGSLE